MLPRVALLGAVCLVSLHGLASADSTTQCVICGNDWDTKCPCSGCTRGYDVDCSNKGIKSLASDHHVILRSSVYNLYLNNNELTEIPDGIFDKLEEVGNLVLTGNPLQCPLPEVCSKSSITHVQCPDCPSAFDDDNGDDGDDWPTWDDDYWNGLRGPLAN